LGKYGKKHKFSGEYERIVDIKLKLLWKDSNIGVVKIKNRKIIGLKNLASICVLDRCETIKERG
jgi:hypothetical protein